jgi:hypothetical protein
MNKRAFCLALLVVPLARAEETFTLGRYVPADSVVYVHSAHNPKSEFINKHWAGVFQAVGAAGIDQEIKNLALAHIEDQQQKASFSQAWDGVARQLGQVRWSELGGRECAFYVRLKPAFELGCLFRPTPESVEPNVQALTSLLKTVVALPPEPLQVIEADLNGVKTWSAGVDGAALAVLHKGEIIGIVAGRMGAQPCAQMLAGSGEASSMAASSRLKQALEPLPRPEDALAFIDFGATLGTLRNFLTGMMPPQTEQQPQEMKMTLSLLEQFDVIDYLAAVERTEGLASLTHQRVQLLEGAAGKPLIRAFTANKPIEDYARFVPATATGFTATSGCDTGILYQAALDFVRDKVPGGPEHLKSWEDTQADIGFNVRQDLISWMDGRVLSVTMPPAVQTGMSGNDFVLMLKARDAKMAISKINGWLDQLNAALSDSKSPSGGIGALIITPASDVKAEGFKSVTHPMVAMMMVSLTYGIHEDWLVLGSSSSAINKCLETARGQGARFVDSERYKKEGLAASGAANVSFTDLSNLGQELSMGLQMMQMTAMFIPMTPENAPLRSLFGVLSRLAPAAARMDFMLSESSAAEWQGNGWTLLTKTTYREYVPRDTKTEAEKKKGLDGL